MLFASCKLLAKDGGPARQIERPLAESKRARRRAPRPNRTNKASDEQTRSHTHTHDALAVTLSRLVRAAVGSLWGDTQKHNALAWRDMVDIKRQQQLLPLLAI